MQKRKNIFPGFPGVLLGFFLLQACGDLTDEEAVDDGTFSEETVTLTVTVAEPVSADLSPPALTVGKRGLALKSPAMATSAGASYDVMVRDLNNFPTIYTCTTSADGTCEIEIPVEMAEQGANIIADNGSIVMKSMVVNTPEALAVNPGTDLTAAIVNATCDGDLGNCPLDIPSLVSATDAFVSDIATRTDHEEDSMGEVISGLVTAHEELILALSGDDLSRSARMMAEALKNETGAEIEALGVAIPPGFLTGANIAADAMTAYCDETDPVWVDAVTNAAAETGLDAADVARTIVGVIEEFKPVEITNLSDLEFQNQALAVTAVNDLVEKGVTEPKIRQAIAELIRLGAMIDSDLEIIEGAMGLLVSTFPADFSAYNTEMAARTVHLFNAQLVADTDTRYSAETLASAHADALKDPALQFSIATGGKRAFNTYLANFIATNDPATFDALTRKADIKAGPGSSCTADSDCGGLLCADGTCTPDSITLGGSCGDASDCTDGETCAGYHAANRFCMLIDSIPSSVTTFRSGDATTPFVMGDITIPAGETGTACPCASGFTCTSSIASAGVCRSSTLIGYKAPGNRCTANVQCVSGTCSAGRCAFTASFLATQGTFIKPIGTSCSSHYQCESGWCNSGTCDTPPEFVTNLFTGGGVSLRNLGASCSANYQCSSFWCEGGQCLTFGSPASTTANRLYSGVGTRTSGQTCGFTSECALGLSCVSGTCASVGPISQTCASSTDCADPATQYCREFVCVAKSTAGQTCAATSTSTQLGACATGLFCNSGTNQCETPKVTVQASFPAPVANKNFQCWIGTVSNYTSALYLSSNMPVTGDQATASFPVVPAGTYFVGCKVDNDNSGTINKSDYRGFHNGPPNSKPAAVASVVVPASGAINVNFPLYTIPSVLANVTLPGSVTGKPVNVWIRSDNSAMGGPYVITIPSFTGNVVAVQFPNVPAGTYFIGASSDLNGGGIGQNDYRGWHNGAGSNPPGGASITVPATGDFTVNFPIQTVP